MVVHSRLDKGERLEITNGSEVFDRERNQNMVLKYRDTKLGRCFLRVSYKKWHENQHPTFCLNSMPPGVGS